MCRVKAYNNVKNALILFIKGIVMGVANLIPGISGGTIALVLGIYKKFIHALGHFFSDFKNNIKFLLPLGLGLIFCFLTLSRLIEFSFATYPVAVSLFFVGLVIGGIPMILKKLKISNDRKSNVPGITAMIFAFILVIALSLIDRFGGGGDNVIREFSLFNIVMLFLIGAIVAGTMVIPGISGSLILMLLGWYDTLIGALSELGQFKNVGKNIIIALIFGIGVIVGLVLISKFIEYLFKQHERTTYFGVLGFIAASAVAIPIVTIPGFSSFGLLETAIGAALLIVGFFVSYLFSRKSE